MPTLNDRSAEADAYVAAFRRQRPGAATRARNWEAIARRTAAPPEPTILRPRWRRPVLSIAATLAIAAALLLLLRGVGVGLSALSERARRPAQQAPDQLEPRAPRAVTSPPTRAGAAPEPVVERPTASPEPAPSPASQRPASSPPRSAPPSAIVPEIVPGPEDALAEETRLLAEARRALSSADPTAALEPLREHARRFPQGALTEERMAYEAIAQCHRSPPRPEAARRFLAAHAGSVHAPRVRAACGTEP